MYLFKCFTAPYDKSGVDVRSLEKEVNKWLLEKGDTITIEGMVQSECASERNEHRPNERITISFLYKEVVQ